MNVQPLLACGPDFSIILFIFAPVFNCVVTFIAGAICSAMGNKTIGSWTMSISAFVFTLFFAGTLAR